MTSVDPRAGVVLDRLVQHAAEPRKPVAGQLRPGCRVVGLWKHAVIAGHVADSAGYPLHGVVVSVVDVVIGLPLSTAPSHRHEPRP